MKQLENKYAEHKKFQTKKDSQKNNPNDPSDLQVVHDDDSSDAKSEKSQNPQNMRRVSKMPTEAEKAPESATVKEISINEKIKTLINPDFAKMIDDDIKMQIIELDQFDKRQKREHREQDISSDNKIENEEQAKRLQQLKREQELAEFEEKGGFGRILRNFFNPNDESIELDSVYQLKQL